MPKASRPEAMSRGPCGLQALLQALVKGFRAFKDQKRGPRGSKRQMEPSGAKESLRMGELHSMSVLEGQKEGWGCFKAFREHRNVKEKSCWICRLNHKV